ncbi:esterase [Rhodococcus oxybenzonivorans]|uniref:Esterase n=1 Tax=Rhodococcus oxybenzonivorans TaxID=1990687 RepID=A0A2S2BYP8_9NOCA|nr:serine hydrolase domain-containing protein [Rhodococcus oxybenzonivorans]AWK73699.1 esterase [Rhodococcus oxybenzonivorans]
MTTTTPWPLIGRTARPPAGMLVDRRFGRLVDQFFQLFRDTRQGGGALSVYLHGEPVVDVWAGWASRKTQWNGDTVTLTFSTGKGVASTVLHRLAGRGVIDYDVPIAQYWPEFAAAGKEAITVRELLSHRAGLHRVRGLVPEPLSLMDHSLVSAALAAATPDRRRLRAPGYHAVTFGSLIAEVTSRASGQPFTELVKTEIAEPLGVKDFWYAVPLDERGRIARTFPHINPFGVPWAATSFAMSRLPGLRNVADAGMPAGFDLLVRNPAVHDSVMPGWNGVFSARALAKMYGALANGGSVGGVEFLAPDVVTQLGEVQTTGRDYVLGLPMNWRLGYHAGMVARRTQPSKTFGHYGLGGSGAFADAETGLSIAFVTNRLGNMLTPIADLRLPKLGSTALALAAKA